jgi:RNA polymerase sigma factor (sigma-70 family)
MTNWERRAADSVLAGNPDVEAIYLAHRDAMRATAAAKLHGADALGLDADDIVGDVVVRLLDGTITLAPTVGHRLRAHLRRITANKAIDLIREREAASKATRRRHPADPTDVEADVETMVLAEMTEERMHLLNERERHVIVENVKKGRLAKDVALDLGCTPQNVSQLRASALRKLSASLPFVNNPPSDK